MLTEIIEQEFNKAVRSRNTPRWNTNFLILERAAEFDWSKTTFGPNYRLSAKEHEILKEFVLITRSVQEVLLELQSATNPTISTVIPGGPSAAQQNWGS